MVFFDTPVCRGWISHSHIQPYTEGCDLNASSGVSTLEHEDCKSHTRQLFFFSGEKTSCLQASLLAFAMSL